MKIAYVYQCECGEEYYMREKKEHYCDWVECDSEEPLEFIREEVGQ